MHKNIRILRSLRNTICHFRVGTPREHVGRYETCTCGSLYSKIYGACIIIN